MPDGSITVGESKAGFNESPIDLIEEAELHRICSVGPDSKVAAPIGKGRA